MHPSKSLLFCTCPDWLIHSSRDLKTAFESLPRIIQSSSSSICNYIRTSPPLVRSCSFHSIPNSYAPFSSHDSFTNCMEHISPDPIFHLKSPALTEATRIHSTNSRRKQQRLRKPQRCAQRWRSRAKSGFGRSRICNLSELGDGLLLLWRFDVVVLVVPFCVCCWKDWKGVGSAWKLRR